MTSNPLPAADAATLTEVLASARCVMFDFDGPLAHLFAGLRASDVADVLRSRLASWHAPSFARPFTKPDDPHQVLLDVAKVYDSPEYSYRVAELDKLLTEQEIAAAASAVPTQHSDSLVRRLAAMGKSVAVTTNNAAAAAAAYLESRGLLALFDENVHGRSLDPRQLKPHPHCLVEAMLSTRTRSAECVMIGDSPSDFEAAATIGVAFLGYARNERKRKALEQAGARHIVSSMAAVIDAAAHG